MAKFLPRKLEKGTQLHLYAIVFHAAAMQKKKGTNDDAVSRTLSVDAYSKRLVPLTNYVKTALEHQKREERDKERGQDRGKNRKKKRVLSRGLFVPTGPKFNLVNV